MFWIINGGLLMVVILIKRIQVQDWRYEDKVFKEHEKSHQELRQLLNSK